MDTIQEALEQIHSSEEARSIEGRNLYLARAQALATLALAEQIEKLTEKMPDKELSGKRIVITVNDDTTQDQIDSFTQAVGLMADQLKITAVIVYEGGKDV